MRKPQLCSVALAQPLDARKTTHALLAKFSATDSCNSASQSAAGRMKRPVSVDSTTLAREIGYRKLGHPVPESNFVRESRCAVSQEMQRYRPSA